jgi:hypothetical protein
LPAALGSNAAHRSKAATFATRLTQHIGQVEEACMVIEKSAHQFVWIQSILLRNIASEPHGLGTIF